MRFLRIISAIAVFVVVVVSVVMVIAWFIFRDVAGLGRVNASLAALPQVTLSGVVSPGIPLTGTVPFKDGTDGWFLIERSASLTGVKIGMHGPRLAEALVGGTGISRCIAAAATTRSSGT